MEVDLADMEDFELCPELTVPLKRMPHQSAGSTFTVLQVCLPYCSLTTVLLGVTCFGYSYAWRHVLGFEDMAASLFTVEVFVRHMRSSLMWKQHLIPSCNAHSAKIMSLRMCVSHLPAAVRLKGITIAQICKHCNVVVCACSVRRAAWRQAAQWS